MIKLAVNMLVEEGFQYADIDHIAGIAVDLALDTEFELLDGLPVQTDRTSRPHVLAAG